MAIYKMDKNIPLPQTHKYPLDQMVVGDSFLAATPDGDDPKIYIHRTRAAVSAYKKKHGGKFTTRAVDGGIRIWCIKPSERNP